MNNHSYSDAIRLTEVVTLLCPPPKLSFFNLSSRLCIGGDENDALAGDAGGVRCGVANGLILSIKFMAS
jgi:hypothetical protein